MTSSTCNGAFLQNFFPTPLAPSPVDKETSPGKKKNKTKNNQLSSVHTLLEGDVFRLH